MVLFFFLWNSVLVTAVSSDFRRDAVSDRSAAVRRSRNQSRVPGGFAVPNLADLAPPRSAAAEDVGLRGLALWEERLASKVLLDREGAPKRSWVYKRTKKYDMKDTEREYRLDILQKLAEVGREQLEGGARREDFVFFVLMGVLLEDCRRVRLPIIVNACDEDLMVLDRLERTDPDRIKF